MIEWKSDGTPHIDQEIIALIQGMPNKHIQHNQLREHLPDHICCACYGQFHGILLICRLCHSYVHEHCYYPGEPLKQQVFTCSGCLAKESGNYVKCCICEKSGGMLSSAQFTNISNAFVHLCCVMWDPALSFFNGISKIEGGLHNLPHRYNQEICQICNENRGVKIKVL